MRSHVADDVDVDGQYINLLMLCICTSYLYSVYHVGLV
jgi:hypothetical protein